MKDTETVRRKRTDPKKKWTDQETDDLIKYLLSNKPIARPTAEVYYNQFLQQCNFSRPWQIVRCKVTNLHVGYLKTKNLLKTAGSNMQAMENLKARCPYYDQLEIIFSNNSESCGNSNELDDIKSEFGNTIPKLEFDDSDKCSNSEESASGMSIFNRLAEAADYFMPNFETPIDSNKSMLNASNDVPQTYASPTSNDDRSNGNMTIESNPLEVTPQISFDDQADKWSQDLKIHQMRIELDKEKLEVKRQTWLYESEKHKREMKVKELEIQSQERVQLYELQMKERLAIKELELKERIEMKKLSLSQNSNAS